MSYPAPLHLVPLRYSISLTLKLGRWTVIPSGLPVNCYIWFFPLFRFYLQVCVSVYTCFCMFLQRPEKDIRFPTAGVIVGCEPQCGCQNQTWIPCKSDHLSGPYICFIYPLHNTGQCLLFQSLLSFNFMYIGVLSTCIHAHWCPGSQKMVLGTRTGAKDS